MSGHVGQALLYALLLVLPLSALAARRLPMNTLVLYAGAWMAIFGGAFVLVALLSR
ncbi:aspartyl protease family protein [Sphingomonas palmae]|uniref:Aspartyl protease family protein n=1 Tax=Sphingomonas palmae TaxID=1855283 RepID=A0A1H7GI71_9SPHN|nr:aspartyl protease family protein [Sphingomonas palmae]